MKRREVLDVLAEDELQIINSSRLSRRHREFVVLYLRERSAAEAARLCGYGKPWKSAGYTILTRPDVSALVKRLLNGRLRRLHVTAERIEDELAKIAFSSIGNFIHIQDDGTPCFDLTEADAIDLAAIGRLRAEAVEQVINGEKVKVLKISIDLHSKVHALAQLARIRRMASPDAAPDANGDAATAIRDARRRIGIETQSGDDPPEDKV